jgi:acyl-CoA hydrolase
MTVAVGDGFGAPRSVSRQLSEAAARCGGVRLILGWVPKHDPGLDFTAFADVRTFMPGWGLRRATDAGQVSFAPVRMSAVPALLHGPWRPDLLVATVVPAHGGFQFGSEVSWQRAAISAGAFVAAVVSYGAPHADAGSSLPDGQVLVVGDTSEPPAVLSEAVPAPAHEAIARRIAPHIPPRARLQVGPSPVATALLGQLTVPVRLDTGLLPEGVVNLDERGLLAAEPVAAYLAGGRRLYDWADGRPLLHPVEYTHDLGRLSADPLFAVNPAVEIDLDGQVNVEGTAASALGGIGGHPDYAAAAARSVGGLSIVAVPATHDGRSTLVTRLSRPVSTPSHDVDVVVTERGLADLRGLSRPERYKALIRLWDGQVAVAAELRSVAGRRLLNTSSLILLSVSRSR